MSNKNFSIIVGATKLPISFIGKPSLLSCQNGVLQILNIVNGKQIICGRIGEFSFEYAKTSMIKITKNNSSLYVFGTGSGLKDKAESAILKYNLPPLVGYSKKAELLPNILEEKGKHEAAKNVTELLPELLQANRAVLRSQ